MSVRFKIVDLEIEVPDDKIRELKQSFKDENGEEPDENDLDNIIYNYVDETALFAMDTFRDYDLEASYYMVDTVK